MFVKMQTTCTWTERPYEALLFRGIGFGPFLRSLGARRRRPPSGGQAISEIPLWKSSEFGRETVAVRPQEFLDSTSAESLHRQEDMAA
ncbi:hypothetical protein ZWY2020_034400 [Hordeum vulgare]|nr:hypothetical protein ZWY2020_034400 [Hordeum vulgare]